MSPVLWQLGQIVAEPPRAILPTAGISALGWPLYLIGEIESRH